MSEPKKGDQQLTNSVVQGASSKTIKGKGNWLRHRDGCASQFIDYAILEGRHTEADIVQMVRKRSKTANPEKKVASHIRHLRPRQPGEAKHRNGNHGVEVYEVEAGGILSFSKPQ